MIVFEDPKVARLGPLAQTRPVFELRCGSVSLSERQRRCLAADDVSVVVRPELAALCRFSRPVRPVIEPPRAGTEPVVLVNGRWLAPDSAPSGLAEPHAGLVGEQLAYLVLPQEAARELSVSHFSRVLAQWSDALPARPAGGSMIDYPWDLVENNARALEQDERHWRTHREAVSLFALQNTGSGQLQGVTVQGPPERLLVDPLARVEPMVLIDTTGGPVMLDRGARVQAFSRLEGPCYIGPGTHVLAGRLKGVSIGPHCRIGGEVESAIVHGYSNKAHDGFLGHSYVGEWVNLGAGTHTSDLRNDYSKVTVVIAGHKVETGLLKVGSFIGDHTKTSIDTLFNTGSVCGPFGMLVASGGLLPRSLPAFCQYSDGRLRARTHLGALFATAETMMARRDAIWSSEHTDFYLDLYERTASERDRLVRDTEQRLLRRVV
jgi:UDP-N-acetylglucosamine diphosphorylase/glucosamine-1-phosphate N-acetyltransferase